MEREDRGGLCLHCVVIVEITEMKGFTHSRHFRISDVVSIQDVEL
jgi:hypothetical protein